MKEGVFLARPLCSFEILFLQKISLVFCSCFSFQASCGVGTAVPFHQESYLFVFLTRKRTEGEEKLLFSHLSLFVWENFSF